MKKIGVFLCVVFLSVAAILAIDARDSFGAMKTIKLSLEPGTGGTEVAVGFRLYWDTTQTAVVNKTTSNRLDIGNKTSACISLDDTRPFYYLGATAYDANSNESTVTVGYFLFGNIVGGYNDGTASSSARVDGNDLTTLGMYWGQMVTHQVYDCNSTFVITLPTNAQKADLNRDGRVDGRDLIELGLRFGNAAQ